MRHWILIFAGVSLTSCGNHTDQTTPPDFFDNLSALCGHSYAGKVISNDDVDADWRKETLIIHVRDCTESRIDIPLHVGENRSRTWVISKTDDEGYRLSHDHRHEDGEPDKVSLYGGVTVSDGTPLRQEFPADEYSVKLFLKEGLSASVDNVWALTLNPGQTLTYELKRPGRLFQAEFDLTQTVATPPPVWGAD